jgi:type I restriction enzyme M protein
LSKIKKKNGQNSKEQSFEEKLWDSAEKLRGPLESASYKYVVLGLLFLKFSSDIFEDRKIFLIEETKNPKNKEYFQKDPKTREYVINDPDEYHKESALFIRKGNTWEDLMKSASHENLGIKIDKMLNEIEIDNSVLSGVMPKIYSSIKLPNENISELINLFSNIKHGETRGVDFDFLGRTYEFFLGKFSSKEDTRAGEFYTPHSIVKLISEILEPKEGKIYDPTCGSGGMFVQSMEFHKAHKKESKGNLSFYAQEFKEGIWQICKMNLILRGIDTSNVKQGDSLVSDHHPSLKANFIMANPPFNMKEWGYNQLKSEKRWKFGLPSYTKAGGNYAFMQHMLYHLDEKNGKMGLVLANGSLSAGDTELEIRKKIVDANLVDCVIELGVKLFYTVTIPVCIWIFNSNKDDHKTRKRNDETLFIYARELVTPIERSHNIISKKQIEHIVNMYRSYVGMKDYPKFKDIPGQCAIATKKEIADRGYILTPGRYVGTDYVDDDDETFDQKMQYLIKEYANLNQESNDLDKSIRKNLGGLGFEL